MRATCARSARVPPDTDLHDYVHVLLHLQQFLIRRQVWYPPYGPWERIPAHVWAAHAQEVGDNGHVCALCCTECNPEKLSMCDKLTYCTECIDACQCDKVTVT